MNGLFKGLGYIFAGFLLSSSSDVVAILGDNAPLAENGVSQERLLYHVLALLILIGSVVCFIRGGYLMFRLVAAGVTKRAADPASTIAVAPESDFDADAVFAKYMKRRTEQAPDGQPEPPQPQPPRGGFGRKGV